MSISIRNLMPHDFAQADMVVRAAFERDVDFQPMLRLHLRIEPEGLWAAWSGERIVGTASAVDYGPLAYLGLMTVHPRVQRQGVGVRLLEHALAWLEARDCPVVLLDATDKGAPLYERYQFIDDALAGEWVAMARPAAPCLGIASNVRLEPNVAAAELAAFETPYFGANRHKLLAALLTSVSARTLVARDEAGRLTGFLIARDPLLGPWCAANPAVTEDLLRAALSLPFEHPPLVQVPRSNQLAGELLPRFGFTQRRSLRHMRRGGLGPLGEPAGLFGQASFGHG